MNIIKAMQSALHYYQNGDLEHAGRICRDILKKQPKNPDVLHLLGVISYQSRNYGAAIQYFKKSLIINPANSETYYNLGRVFQHIGEIGKAIDSFQNALEYNPYSVDACLNLGNLFQEKKEFDEAIQYYQKAIQINPSFAGVYYNLGVVLQEKEQMEWFPENWGKIILTDATGKTYTLYAVQGEVDLSQYELPPSPLEGMFDIRFSSGRIAEDIYSSVKTIDMSEVTYPLTVKAENMDMHLMDETGKSLSINLKDGEDVVIRDATIQKLMVSRELIPDKYSLEQNYPNPFNPSTKIRYQLPKETKVTIKIYDILGAEVISLVDENKEPGYYEVEFNGIDLSSGIYIYRMIAGDFVAVKKMILLR